MLMVAGLQAPVIPLLDVVANTGAALFKQRGPIASKLDTTELAILTSIVTTVAHCPPAGVKVYVDVPKEVVLIAAGLHVPVTPLLDVVANTGGALFRQSAPIVLNVGVTLGVTVTFSVVVVAHCPAAGVKV